MSKSVRRCVVVSALLVALGWYAGTLDFGRWEGGQSIMGVPGIAH